MEVPNHMNERVGEILSCELNLVESKRLWAVILGLEPELQPDGRWIIAWGLKCAGIGMTPMEAMVNFDCAIYEAKGIHPVKIDNAVPIPQLAESLDRLRAWHDERELSDAVEKEFNGWIEGSTSFAAENAGAGGREKYAPGKKRYWGAHGQFHWMPEILDGKPGWRKQV